jgi:hypothetical protein
LCPVQILTGVIQYGSTADDFEVEEVGSTIEVSPSNSASCDQQVHQAATVSGWEPAYSQEA